MSCTIVFDAGVGVVKATYIGNEEFDSLSSSVDATIKELLDNNCSRLLCDLSQSTIRMSVFEIVRIEKIINDAFRAHNILPMKIKRAMVRKINKANLDNYHFFETSSVNNLHRVKVFSQSDEALDWLLK